MGKEGSGDRAGTSEGVGGAWSDNHDGLSVAGAVAVVRWRDSKRKISVEDSSEENFGVKTLTRKEISVENVVGN